MRLIQTIDNDEFYPTPATLVKRMLAGIDWNMVQTVLEPSAGKGDILREVALATESVRHDMDIDCIEADASLRQVLRYNFSEERKDSLNRQQGEIIKNSGCPNAENRFGKWKQYNRDTGYTAIPEELETQLNAIEEEKKTFFADGIHIVGEDFLAYEPFKQYNLIVMNPPFSNGDKHLLKALEMQRTHGGSVVCLLNAETIRNPYTATRKELVRLLNEYDASIEYLEQEFANAEKKTAVEVALIKVAVPERETEQDIFDRMAQTEHYEEFVPDESKEIEVADFVRAIVNRYKVEMKSGLELIRLYKGMKPYLESSFDENELKYRKPLIQLKDEGDHDLTINKYVKSVRLKYWKALLSNKKFVGKLTSTLQQQYREQTSSYANYDFSEFNIRTLLAEMNTKIKVGIEEEIGQMYDRLTEEHAYYPECQKNRHLYDGWKTNKAWKIGKKVILPCYGIFDSWSGKPRTYEAYNTLADIERILNFFDGDMTAEVNLENELRKSFEQGITKNIACKFFRATFYKKGTVHITFTCPELIDRFNIYAAQNRGWLPPSYGKKSYKDMTAEEKTVIDSFQGEKAYNEVMAKSDYYLASPIENRPLLTVA